MLFSGPGKVLARQAACLAASCDLHGVIALLDRDYDHHLDRQIDHPNVVYTDETDFEITIIKSGAFEEFLHEFLDFGDRDRILEDLHCESIAEYLLNIAGVVGILRFLNSRHTWNIRCRDIDISQIYDSTTKKIDPEKLVQHAIDVSEEVRAAFEAISSEMNKALACIENIADYATGHDTTRLLAHLLSSRVWLDVELTVDPLQVEQGLRLSFSTEYFRATKIYTAFRKWEAVNQPFSLLAS